MDSLRVGINLAAYVNTPQYQQAVSVRKSLFDLWKKEGELRTIQYVELKFLQNYTQKGNMDSLKVYLGNLYAKKQFNSPYYKTQFDRYLELKPRQQQMEIEYAGFHKLTYELAQPKEHTILISKQPKQ